MIALVFVSPSVLIASVALLFILLHPITKYQIFLQIYGVVSFACIFLAPAFLNDALNWSVSISGFWPVVGYLSLHATVTCLCVALLVNKLGWRYVA